MKQVGGFSISFLQCVLVISGICRFWVSTYWLLHVIIYENKEVARVQLRAAIQKQEKGPGTPLPESLSGFSCQDTSVLFVSFFSAFKSSGCTLAKTDSRGYSEGEKWSYQTKAVSLTTHTVSLYFLHICILECSPFALWNTQEMESALLGPRISPWSQACFLWDTFLVPICICLEELSQQGRLLLRPLWHQFPVISISET